MAMAKPSTPLPSPLASYLDDFLECREGHIWRRVGFFRDGLYISQLSNCTRCYCRKIRTMRSNGELIKTNYQHPEGYLIKGVHFDKIDVRRETLRRAGQLQYGSVDELIEATVGGGKR